MIPLEPRITKLPRREARLCGARRVPFGRNKDERRRLSKRPGKGKCEQRPSCATLRRRNGPVSRPPTTCNRNRPITIPGGGGLVFTTPFLTITGRKEGLLTAITCPDGCPAWVLRAVR